ncbi:hypothetical protein BCR41DRAFT_73848 [Lobosporangium transversale]|uniref:FYVE-type domain-containing protein n=1 Tax=Lobosporangium transversale TaxID=64571 RepID=A0A1Y2H359_9FUNG|nr:hypothetical protein BCR41DRAFT_73848 [Lobosporangium transversale]ORZ28431.1 hypothetical protein BCR41DRAFT_73848 [Lobosporangium transversale]|eukprot:XP_021886116.1 hypothetical protein BCR41DRAFT_73848 [Lobosporangium transversale]
MSDISGVWSSTRRRIASAPLMSYNSSSNSNSSGYNQSQSQSHSHSQSYISGDRFDRDNDSLRSNASLGITGPSRAHWKPDSSTNVCTWPGCRVEFGLFDRRHHCRKCGDIFCSTHCSKEVPLDQALDFNPIEGRKSRACVGCFEQFERWQGKTPTSSNSDYIFNNSYGNSNNNSNSNNNNSSSSYNSVYHSANSGGNSSANSTDPFSAPKISLSPIISAATQRPNIGRIPDGFLGGQSTREAIGRDDIVRRKSPSSRTIPIKRRPSTDPTVMPMPSVPHDWSWSTF